MTKKYYTNTREEMLEFIPTSAKKILEVGCANGTFGAKIIERQNAEVWGIEPVNSAAKQAELILFKVINKTFSIDINIPKDYFDVIIFNDVLEHMVEPSEALEISKIFLNNKSSSVIVASIPNFRFVGNIYEILIEKDFRYKEAGILDRTHYRFFTKKSIIRLFHENNFSIIELKGISQTNNLVYKLLNLITFNFLNDMKYRQFAVIAKVKGKIL